MSTEDDASTNLIKIVDKIDDINFSPDMLIYRGFETNDYLALMDSR